MSKPVELGDGIYFQSPNKYTINIAPTKNGISIFVQDTDFDQFLVKMSASNSFELIVEPNFDHISWSRYGRSDSD